MQVRVVMFMVAFCILWHGLKLKWV